mmetsp:Transcript_43893/g.93425  ORF Transcript_43893/g.93425 Transcript_43893/m.93425 type:complete len:226 (+) Transcript_43893:920-1597(+)
MALLACSLMKNASVSRPRHRSRACTASPFVGLDPSTIRCSLTSTLARRRSRSRARAHAHLSCVRPPSPPSPPCSVAMASLRNFCCSPPSRASSHGTATHRWASSPSTSPRARRRPRGRSTRPSSRGCSERSLACSPSSAPSASLSTSSTPPRLCRPRTTRPIACGTARCSCRTARHCLWTRRRSSRDSSRRPACATSTRSPSSAASRTSPSTSRTARSTSQRTCL